MASPLFPLRYFLPTTRLRITAHEHEVVVTDGTESRLEPVVDVVVTPRAEADRTARCLTTIDAGLLEKISIKVNLDDDGMIRSLNSESSRDPSPVLTLAGRVLGTVAGAVGLPFGARGVAPADVGDVERGVAPTVEEDEGEQGPPPSLEQRWSEENPRLHALAASLSMRVGALLDQLAAAEDPARITAVGQALTVVHRELAAVDRARREWISGQAKTIRRVDVDVPLAAVHHVDAPELPSVLDDAGMTGAAEELTPLGVLIAVADPHRPRGGVMLTLDHEDQLLFRLARPVTIGVYEKVDGKWQARSELSLQLDVVDEFSSVECLSLDGSWLRTRTVDLSFHPDMSVETYGAASTSTVSSIVTGAGSVLDPLDAALKKQAEAPSAAERALADRKLELDTLKTTDELAQLSRLRERSVELAELEQRAAIATARTTLGGTSAV